MISSRSYTLIGALLILAPLLQFPTASTGGGAGGSTMASGHMVFVEDITATWCGYCPEASQGLSDLSAQRGDFRFVTLVDDRVPDAASRNEEYNPSGFPTVMFDGGYEEVIGAPSSTDAYDAAVDSCQERDAPPISVIVDCFDEGGSRLRIDLEVENGASSEYSGRLLVNVVEIVSRYQDSDGSPYPYSLLGYAADEDISIQGGESYTTSIDWVGSAEKDLLGNDFSDIDPSNIVIYAVVFNSDSNLKVRKTVPPSYYTAHYADAMGEAHPQKLGGAPDVEITSPREGRRVSGVADIDARIGSENGIDTVEVKIGQGDWLEMSGLDGVYTYSWDTTEVSNGPVRITVKARDREGLVGMDSVEVVVENEGSLVPPEIVEVHHSPQVVKEGDEVMISAYVVEYDTEISSVELTYCIGDICLLPEEMDDEGSGTYSLAIGPFSEGDTVRYNVLVTDVEGNEVRSSDSTFTVQPPSSADGTGNEGAEGDDGSSDGGTEVNSSPAPYFTLLIPALAITMLMLRRRK